MPKELGIGASLMIYFIEAAGALIEARTGSEGPSMRRNYVREADRPVAAYDQRDGSPDLGGSESMRLLTLELHRQTAVNGVLG